MTISATGVVIQPAVLEVINSAATVLATVAAGIATWLALAAQRETNRAGERADQERYYQALVAGPAMERIPTFLAQAQAHLEPGLAEVKSLGRQVELELLDDRIRLLAEEFNRLYLDLRTILAAGLIAYDDEDLLREFSKELDLFQDEIMRRLDTVTSKESSGEVGDLLQRHGAALLKLVRTFHPTLPRGGSTVVPSSVAKARK